MFLSVGLMCLSVRFADGRKRLARLFILRYGRRRFNLNGGASNAEYWTGRGFSGFAVAVDASTIVHSVRLSFRLDPIADVKGWLRLFWFVADGVGDHGAG